MVLIDNKMGYIKSCANCCYGLRAMNAIRANKKNGLGRGQAR